MKNCPQKAIQIFKINGYNNTLKSYQSIISHLRWIAKKALGQD